METKVYQLIGKKISAWHYWMNANKKDSQEQIDKIELQLEFIEKNMLPSGSGVDSGTKILLDKCKSDKIVLKMDFHHMDDNGFYCGWTEHNVTIRPEWDGFSIAISGRDKRQIKDYLGDLIHHALNEVIPVAKLHEIYKIN